MATVPVYERTERATPILRQGVTTQASADDFGAGIGRGMQGLAQGVANVGDVFEKLEEARTKDQDNQLAAWLRDATYNPDTGYMHRAGKGAVDGYSDFAKQVEEKRLEFGQDLSGLAARMYEQASKQRVSSTLQTAMIHAGSEKKAWIREATNSRINTFQEDAIANYRIPKMVTTSIGAGLAELQNKAADEGWDADTLKNQSAEFVSTVRKGVILRMAEDDPLAAEKYMEDHEKQLTGPDQYALEKTLKEGVINEKSKREAARIVGEMTAPQGEALGQGMAGPRRIGGGELTLDTIRKLESFRSAPYWDVNHYRVGYGSDTVTLADGSVLKTTPGMRISVADAERDLSRRVELFQRDMISDVGRDAWNNLPPQAQAALTSVAYNYGTLQKIPSVIRAARSGDQAALATSIRNLGGHNGGVNRTRRNREAAMIGSNATDVREGASRFEVMERQLAGIKDPDVQDATRRRLNSLLEAQKKADEANQKQAEMELFAAVERGGTPDDISIEQRLLAGQSAVSSAWSYHEARIKRGEPETDQTLLYHLRRDAATNPNGFADRNLLEYRDRLDNTAFKELTEAQTSALKADSKAAQEGKMYADAFKQSEQALSAAGLTTTGVKTSDAQARMAMEERIARFQNALKMELDQAKEANGRPTTYDENQAIINALLMKSIYMQQRSAWSPANLFDDGTYETEGGFLFERGNAPEGASIRPVVEYEKIPPDWQSSIKTALTERLGRSPSRQEIEAEYAVVVMEIVGQD